MRSFANDFNYDFHVSFTPADIASGKISYNYSVMEGEKYVFEELPGLSVFTKTNRAMFITPIRVMRGVTRK